jgi:alkylation response protein AidB-like acyl-CoA dehydrogenase
MITTGVELMTIAPSRQVTTNAWLDTARTLAPTIEQHRDQSERERRMARPIFDAIRETQIIEMLVPSTFEGAQANYDTYLRVVEEISRHDGSAGWNVMIWAGGGLFADYLSEETAQQIFGNHQRCVIGGAVNPTGRATPVQGGLNVTGRWSFASGCQYTTWLIAGCIVMDGASPRLLSNGTPDVQAVLLPASDCEIVDTWHTAGLRGTGSHDFQIDDAFVPTERTIPLSAFFVGPALRPGTSHRTPFYDLASPQIAVVGLGIARDAIESLKSLASTKTPAIGTTPIASLHSVQQRVGRAEGLLRSARAYLYETVREVTLAHHAGAPVRDEDCASLRLAAAHCANSAVEAVDLMFDAAGGTSVYESSRLERCFRDVHMVTHHMMAAPLTVEMVGQYLLGGPLQVRR